MEKKVTKKKFTLGYIDVSDQVKGMATNMGMLKILRINQSLELQNMERNHLLLG